MVKVKQKLSVIHVTPTRGPARTWTVVFTKLFNDDNTQVTKEPILADTQKTAIRYGVIWGRYYKPASLKIHGRDGQIREERTFGRNNPRTKG